MVSRLRKAWLRKRMTGIGGSDAPIVMGVSPFCDPLTLWMQKKGLAPDPEENEAMKWGHKLEEVIAKAFAEETGRYVWSAGRFVITPMKKHPKLFATIDRWQRPHRGILATGQYEDKPVQLKTSSPYYADEWGGEDAADQCVPDHCYAQIQHELMVTGCEWGSLAVLIGNRDFRYRDVKADPDYQAKLLKVELEFLALMAGDDPPAADGSWRSIQSLQKLHPDGDGKAVKLGPDFLAVDRRLGRVKGAIKKLFAIKDSLEGSIKAKIGKRTCGVLPNGVVYTWKEQSRGAYVQQVESSSYRALYRKEPKRKSSSAD